MFVASTVPNCPKLLELLMRSAYRRVTYLVVSCSLSVAVVSPALAQGITSAAVQGIVTREGGHPIESALVRVINLANGARQQTMTRSNGRYNLENVTVGGPYTIEVRAIGFEKASKSGVVLALGQRYTADFEMKAQVVTLEELVAISVTNPLINSGRTGPAQTINDTAIARLPLLGRNFTNLIATSPQVVSTPGGGAIIGNQNNRFNNIQIDGGVNNDIFGLAATGTPGGQASNKPLSVEALQEFQILVAPYDVRYGSFSGGLVNAITKSGANKFSGSVFGYLQRQDLVGRDTAGAKFANFSVKQYGGTFGGPIIKDKLHFFVSGDFQTRLQPFVGNETSIPSTGITSATADRVRSIIKSQYGYDPGGPDAPPLGRPDNNVFGKLSWQASAKHFVELSHNVVDSGDDSFFRGSRNRTDRDGWMLSNSGYKFNSKTNSTRLKVASTIGAASNELLVGYQTVRDGRVIPNQVPLFLVQGDVTGNYLAAGGEKFSGANSLGQNIYEVTDNFTFGLGNHSITVGTHNEFFGFKNTFFAGNLGVWTFNSADDLAAARPNRYEVNLEARPGGATADWGVKQLGGYVQDRWQLSDRLSLTGGVRVDVPTNDKPVENTKLASSTLAIHTGNFPSGNALVSPRLGFNYDIFGTGGMVVRGGVGIFSGRPPYVWLSNAFTGTGREQVTLICTGAGIPTLTADVKNLPSTCANAGPPTPPVANVVYFDEKFKFQQAVKYAFGVDHQLGGGVVGTVDLLVTRNRNTMYLNDVNLKELGRNGEGRMTYGTIGSTGSSSPSRVDAANARAAIKHTNRNEDRSWSLTGQIQKRFNNGIQFNAAYTYSKTEDLYTLTSSTATSNLNFTSLDGTLAERNLSRSGFDIPHKVSISGSANLPFGIAASLIYTGRSGFPYAYTANGDANADGITGNDLMFVPKLAGDITLANPADFDALTQFIATEPCLREQRGQVMKRNSCRNPWVGFLDARFGKQITVPGGNRMELTADIFNLLNMLNAGWGLQRETSAFEEFNFLRVVGYDATNQRPKYDLPKSGSTIVLPSLQRVQTFGSRWKIQVGAKYVF